jgi:anti-anti-sigma factor
MAEVRVERDDEIVVVFLTGEVDMSNVTSVRQQIEESISPDDDAAIVDASGLSFMDSAGLHALIELHTVLEERRQRLLLCIPHGNPIERAIEIVGLANTISVYPDLGEATEAARASAMESRPVDPADDV